MDWPEEIREVVQVNKNFPHTRTIDVDWLDHDQGAYLAHNLPKQCFTIYPSEGIIHTCPTHLIMVSYTPEAGRVFDEELWITLVDKLHRAPTLRIMVHMVDNMPSNGVSGDLNDPSLSNSRQASLDCKVCFEPYSDTIYNSIPLLLSECGHTLCHSCADTLQKFSPDKLSIDCPFDRTTTKVKVEKLHKNFAIIDLIREKKDEGKLTAKLEAVVIDEDPILPCYENPKHEATRYCKACTVDFCDSCFHSIHSSRINSDHESILISEKPIKIPPCPNHPTLIAQFFCLDKKCKATSPLCCNKCLFKFHKHHSVITVIEKMEKNQIKLFELLDSLDLTEINVSAALKRADRCIKSTNKTDAEYQKMVDSINIHFYKKMMEAIQNLESYVDQKREGMEKDKQHIEHDMGLIKETKTEIERVLKRRDLLFAQEIIDKGEAMCCLDERKEANLVPLSLPSVEEIIDSKPSSSKPATPSPWSPAPSKGPSSLSSSYFQDESSPGPSSSS
ncbi:unnamed protein product [Caenorhabditis brenneri]